MIPSTSKPTSSSSGRVRVETADFNLEATLESGQVFGFRPLAHGIYGGDLGGSRVLLSCAEGILTAEIQRGPAIAAEALADYFDLGRDLCPLYEILAAEKPLSGALRSFRGLRIIRQDPWDALAGFIISANNNIKRIQGIWRGLSEWFGDRGFPSAEALARTSEETLAACGLGYRAPYLRDSARRVADNPAGFAALRHRTYEEARRELLEFAGVGEKVAACVLLFGFQKLESFPVDTWILRAMRKSYFRGRRVPPKKIADFARRRWNNQAGYVQQYLFHASRKLGQTLLNGRR